MTLRVSKYITSQIGLQIKLWNLPTRKCFFSAVAHDGIVRGVTFHPAGTSFFSVCIGSSTAVMLKLITHHSVQVFSCVVWLPPTEAHISTVAAHVIRLSFSVEVTKQ